MGFKWANSFISDNYNGVRDVRKVLVEETVVTRAYECVTQCLNFFCEVVSKLCFTSSVNQALCICKSMRGTGIVRKLLEALGMKKLGKVYWMFLYSKMRWSSKMMFQRLVKVKEVIIYLAPAYMFKHRELQLDSNSALPAPFLEVINSGTFWDSMAQ